MDRTPAVRAAPPARPLGSARWSRARSRCGSALAATAARRQRSTDRAASAWKRRMSAVGRGRGTRRDGAATTAWKLRAVPWGSRRPRGQVAARPRPVLVPRQRQPLAVESAARERSHHRSALDGRDVRDRLSAIRGERRRERGLVVGARDREGARPAAALVRVPLPGHRRSGLLHGDDERLAGRGPAPRADHGVIDQLDRSCRRRQASRARPRRGDGASGLWRPGAGRRVPEWHEPRSNQSRSTGHADSTLLVSHFDPREVCEAVLATTDIGPL